MMNVTSKPFALQCRHLLAAKPHDGPWYWTSSGDYTLDAARALRFADKAEAHRWINVHKHLRQSLFVAQIVAAKEEHEQAK